MRLDGAKKSQGACQDLSYLEKILVLRCWILGCFFLASYSELAENWAIPQPSLGCWLGGFLPRKDHDEGAPSALDHLAWSEVLHKGQPDCDRWHVSRAEHGRGMAETR